MNRRQKPENVVVSGDEASVVAAGRMIEAAAERRAKEEEKRHHGVCPALFFNSPAEAQIIKERDALALKYQLELGLPVVPNLVAPTGNDLLASRNMGPDSFHYYDRIMGEVPTHMQLETLLLKRVYIKRYGETIYLWDGSCYKKLNDAEARSVIHEYLEKELSVSGNASQLSAVLTILRADQHIEGVPVEEGGTNLLCVKNGLLDLTTLRLADPTPSLFFTSRIEVDWLGPQPCPIFDAFLNQVCGGDPVEIRRIWQLLGYSLVPDNHAKRFAVLQGGGDSGKSVIGNLIASFFDPSAVSNVDVFKLRERFATAELAGKRVNISMDLPAGNLSDQAVGMLKKITGGDTVVIEEKYQSPRSAVINATMIFGTNHELRLWGFDEAFAKRVLLIPFRYSVPKERQNPYLLEQLKGERPGILYRAILEYRELRHNGYVFSGDDRISFFTQCADRGTDPVDAMETFLADCCSVDSEAFTSTESLHLAYLDFCREHRLPALNDRAAFSRQFSTAAGAAVKREKQRVNGVPMNGYRGIILIGGGADV